METIIQSLHNNGYDFYHFKTIDSTMSEAKRLIDGINVSKNIVLLADRQTNGHGKTGTHWLSPNGNIYLTIIYPLTTYQNLSSFSLVAGLALLELVIQHQIKDFEIKIKWPNDIYINNKKAAGILPETYKQNLILGIGINWAVAPENFYKIKEIVDLNQSNFIVNLILMLEYKLYNYLIYGFSCYQNKINDFLYRNGQCDIIEVNDKGGLLFTNEDGIIKERLF